jgi:hypothetical protein
MRHLVLSILLFFVFSNAVFAQLDDGNYKYTNNEITLSFKIEGSGWEISNIILTNNVSKKTLTGTGNYMKAGSIFWYQFHTNECNYEFDVPGAKLTLSQFDCKNGIKKREYLLTRKN